MNTNLFFVGCGKSSIFIINLLLAEPERPHRKINKGCGRNLGGLDSAYREASFSNGDELGADEVGSGEGVGFTDGQYSAGSTGRRMRHPGGGSP